MIEKFKELEMRDSGVIYNSTLKQIKKLYEVDPEKAGELAISAIELVLTGEISSDDMIIELMLTPTDEVNHRNKKKWDQKVENARQKKIREQQLDKIADMVLEGMKQSDIGKKLGISQQAVSYRIGIIRTNYPELLQADTNKNVCTNLVQNGTSFVQIGTDLVQDCTKDTNGTNFVQVGTDFVQNSAKSSAKKSDERKKLNEKPVFDF